MHDRVVRTRTPAFRDVRVRRLREIGGCRGNRMARHDCGWNFGETGGLILVINDAIIAPVFVHVASSSSCSRNRSSSSSSSRCIIVVPAVVIAVFVVIVNDDDLAGHAVLVELGPIGLPAMTQQRWGIQGGRGGSIGVRKGR